MKIKRFNENINSNWSKEKLEKLHDDFNDIGNIVLEYLKINQNEDLKKLAKNGYTDFKLDEFWFEEGENLFNVSYTENHWGSNNHLNYEFSDQEFEDLLIFMNNPEEYKNAKKYNL